MASFFQFTQGTESRSRPHHDSSSTPQPGRFRAVPPRPGMGQRRSSSQLGLLSAGARLLSGGGGRDAPGHGQGQGRGSVHVGYGALIAAALDQEEDDEGATTAAGAGSGVGGGGGGGAGGGPGWWQAWVLDLWVEPRQVAVRKVVQRFWSRYGLLVFLPAALVREPL